MLWEWIRDWGQALLGGAFIGAVLGGMSAGLLFGGLARLGLWRHPRLAGAWRLAVLALLGLHFVSVGILAGSAWGFCRAAEKKILAADLEEAAFLRQKLEPVSVAGRQLIGAVLTLAEHPEWLKEIATAKALPEPAQEALSGFQKGERQLDPELLARHLGSMSREAVERLFPMLEAQIASTRPELLQSPLYCKIRPHLVDLVIGILADKEQQSLGEVQDWLVATLRQASRRDGLPLLSRDELQAAIENEGFQRLCCRPAAALIAAERCQVCLSLLLLCVPVALFAALRRWFRPQSSGS